MDAECSMKGMDQRMWLDFLAVPKHRVLPRSLVQLSWAPLLFLHIAWRHAREEYGLAASLALFGLLNTFSATGHLLVRERLWWRTKPKQVLPCLRSGGLTHSLRFGHAAL